MKSSGVWMGLLLLHVELHVEVQAATSRIYVHYGAARHRMLLHPDETGMDLLGRVCERLNIEVVFNVRRGPC